MNINFEKMLQKFLKTSRDKQQDISKRNTKKIKDTRYKTKKKQV